MDTQVEAWESMGGSIILSKVQKGMAFSLLCDNFLFALRVSQDMSKIACATARMRYDWKCQKRDGDENYNSIAMFEFTNCTIAAVNLRVLIVSFRAV